MDEIDISNTDVDVLADMFNKISELIEKAKIQVCFSVNTTWTNTCFEIGRVIVEIKQQGEKRAEYGAMLIPQLSKELIKKFGKGYSVRNLQQMRKFYLTYSIPQTVSAKSLPQKAQTASAELTTVSKTGNNDIPFALSWSHYLFLMRIENIDERKFYEIESINNKWGIRELKRQFNTSLYERLSLSRDKEGVMKLAQEGQIIEKPEDILKDPYILEFTGLSEKPQYSETQLEQSIIDNLQMFLLEMGKGFTFVGRQERVTFEEEHFYIDLVFYNRILKCFVLVDLKIGSLVHQDIGQMQMYVHYYDRCVKLPDEKPTIGILLCKDKRKSIVEMTLPEDNKQIYASNYMTVLPSKEDLKKIMASQE